MRRGRASGGGGRRRRAAAQFRRRPAVGYRFRRRPASGVVAIELGLLLTGERAAEPSRARPSRGGLRHGRAAAIPAGSDNSDERAGGPLDSDDERLDSGDRQRDSGGGRHKGDGRSGFLRVVVKLPCGSFLRVFVFVLLSALEVTRYICSFESSFVQRAGRLLQRAGLYSFCWSSDFSPAR